MRTVLAYLAAALTAASVFAAFARAEVPPVKQPPNAPSGLMITTTVQDNTPNLLDPEGWVLTYGKREGCTVDITSDSITMTRTTTGWPPCGVSQQIPSASGERFVFTAAVAENTDKSEVYTDFDGSIFNEGIGQRTDILTSKYPKFTIWLQTYTKDASKLPITTTWRNIKLRRLD
jgi:hypothetical protein